VPKGLSLSLSLRVTRYKKSDRNQDSNGSISALAAWKGMKLDLLAYGESI
jgi:hypothetical protein